VHRQSTLRSPGGGASSGAASQAAYQAASLLDRVSTRRSTVLTKIKVIPDKIVVVNNGLLWVKRSGD